MGAEYWSFGEKLVHFKVKMILSIDCITNAQLA